MFKNSCNTLTFAHDADEERGETMSYQQTPPGLTEPASSNLNRLPSEAHPPTQQEQEPSYLSTLIFSLSLGALIIIGWVAAFLLYLSRA